MISGWLLNVDDKIKRELFFRLMRFAGDFIERYTGDAQMSPGGIESRKSFERMQQDPAESSFDPSQMDFNYPEMRPGPYYPGQDVMRDQHILLNPASGVSFIPTIMPRG